MQSSPYPIPVPDLSGSWQPVPGSDGGQMFISSEHADTRRELFALLGRSGIMACDIESYGLGADARRLKTVTIGTDDRAVIIDVRHDGGRAIVTDFFNELVARHQRIAFHNSAFDVPNMAVNGLLNESHARVVTDTLLWARLAFPGEGERRSLGVLWARLNGKFVGKSADSMAAKAMGVTKTEFYKVNDVDRPLFLWGAAEDVFATADIAPDIYREAERTLTDHPFERMRLSAAGVRELLQREQIINRMLLRGSIRGLRVDEERAEQYRAATEQQIYDAEKALEAAGIQPGKGDSLIAVLQELGALPENHPKTPTGRASTQKGVLAQLGHPLAQQFVAHKEITKVLRDYLYKIVAPDGSGLAVPDAHGDLRIHPTVNLLAAATGRMSMSDPPLQQFPGSARGIVMPERHDSMTSLDWSQIEPVVAANMAKDVDTLAGYEDGSSDFYTEVAERASTSRKMAKVVVLALMYGEGMTKLSAQLGITEGEAYDLRDSVFSAMPKTARMLGKLRQYGKQHRKIITLSGRVLDIPMGTYNEQTGVQTHKAVNYFVQGSAYDVLAESLLKIEREGLGDSVYLAMHDELVVSTDAAPDIERIMRTPPDRLVELTGRTPVLRTDRLDLGNRWADA